MKEGNSILAVALGVVLSALVAQSQRSNPVGTSADVSPLALGALAEATNGSLPQVADERLQKLETKLNALTRELKKKQSQQVAVANKNIAAAGKNPAAVINHPVPAFKDMEAGNNNAVASKPVRQEKEVGKQGVFCGSPNCPGNHEAGGSTQTHIQPSNSGSFAAEQERLREMAERLKRNKEAAKTRQQQFADSLRYRLPEILKGPNSVNIELAPIRNTLPV